MAKKAVKGRGVELSSDKIANLNTNETARSIFFHQLGKKSKFKELTDEEIDEILIAASPAIGIKRSLLSNAYSVSLLFSRGKREVESIRSEFTIRENMFGQVGKSDEKGLNKFQRNFLKDSLVLGYHTSKVTYHKIRMLVNSLRVIRETDNKFFKDKGINLLSIMKRVERTEYSEYIDGSNIDTFAKVRLDSLRNKVTFSMDVAKDIIFRFKRGAARRRLKNSKYVYKDSSTSTNNEVNIEEI